MKMIDEVHLSQEGDDEEEKDQPMKAQNDSHSSSSKDSFYEWNRVKPDRSQKKYIELKDINESDFLELIEAKN